MLDARQTSSPLHHPSAGEIDLPSLLHALSDPMRLEIVRSLFCAQQGELACKEIELPVSKATASHHFKVLREAGVLEGRDEGTRRYHTVRRDDLDASFPGLLDSILGAAVRSAVVR